MLPRPLGLILWLALLFPLCITQSNNTGTDSHKLVCDSDGSICEPCPAEAMHRPYCQPFGNRRLIQCRNTTSVAVTSDSSTTTDTKAGIDTEPDARPPYAQRPPSAPEESSDDPDPNLIFGWEACGRVVSTERADFFEFVAVNLLFVCISAGIVIWRSRRMRVLHARQLAARIGMVGRRR